MPKMPRLSLWVNRKLSSPASAAAQPDQLCRHRHLSFSEARTFCRRPPHRCAELRISGIFSPKTGFSEAAASVKTGRLMAERQTAHNKKHRTPVAGGGVVLLSFPNQRLRRQLAVSDGQDQLSVRPAVPAFTVAVVIRAITFAGAVMLPVFTSLLTCLNCATSLPGVSVTTV